MTCIPTTDGHCQNHGSVWDELRDRCTTTALLARVSLEREEQFRRYGTNSDLEEGIGSDAQWLLPVSHLGAKDIEWWFRQEYEEHKKPTWTRLVREEMAEAFMETDPSARVDELLQVAALCVSWSEKILEGAGDRDV